MLYQWKNWTICLLLSPDMGFDKTLDKSLHLFVLNLDPDSNTSESTLGVKCLRKGQTNRVLETYREPGMG